MGKESRHLIVEPAGGDVLPPDRNSYIVVIGISTVGIALGLFVVLGALLAGNLTAPQRIGLGAAMALALPIYVVFIVLSVRRMSKLPASSTPKVRPEAPSSNAVGHRQRLRYTLWSLTVLWILMLVWGLLSGEARAVLGSALMLILSVGALWKARLGPVRLRAPHSPPTGN